MSAAPMKENTKKVFRYVESMDGENITAADVADAVGIGLRSANGIITSFTKKGLMERKPAEEELPDGTHKSIKLIVLTEKGREFDPDAVVITETENKESTPEE